MRAAVCIVLIAAAVALFAFGVPLAGAAVAAIAGLALFVTALRPASNRDEQDPQAAQATGKATIFDIGPDGPLT